LSESENRRAFQRARPTNGALRSTHPTMLHMTGMCALALAF
jgi:hypothetical protein